MQKAGKIIFLFQTFVLHK